MSVITSLEPVPNRVRSLVRLIASTKELPRDRVTDFFMPGLQRKADQVNNVLREAIRMKLIQANDNTLVLGDGLRERDVKDDEWFADYIDRRLVGCELPDDDDNRPVGFATAWLLTRPLVPALDWNGENTEFMRADLHGDDIYDLTNASRMAMLAGWARFAGYAEALAHNGKTTIVPDPTRALTRRLPEMFIKEKVLPISVFLERMASAATLLEGGVVRSKVEARLRQARDLSTLSQSTSLGLLRLEKRHVIELKSESDADLRLLDLRVGEKRRVSHIAFKRS